MRGRLIRVHGRWFVKYEVYSTLYGESGIKREIIQLHPTDEARFNIVGKLPNDQHIMDGKECEFDIVKEQDDQNSVGDIIYKEYALLKMNEVSFNNVKIDLIETIITDEQIEEEASKIDYGGGSNGWIKDAFIKGAKWMQEQLKNNQNG